MFTFFKNRSLFFNSLSKIYLYLISAVYSVLNPVFNKFDINLLELDKKELSLYNYYYNKKNQEFFINALFFRKFFFIDLISFIFNSFRYTTNSKISLFRSFFRINNSDYGFYFNFKSLFNYNNLYFYLKNIFLSGWKYIWKGVRFWILALMIGLGIIYYSMVIRCLPFNKTLFVWVCFMMFAYWLISGFVFFIKKYQFGKYTTVIQRFWRRTYILFWLIEFFLFVIYLYLTMNANQESYYMFDQIQVFKSHLFSWRLFILKLFPLTFLLIFGYLFLLTIKWNVLSKHTLWLIVITALLIYVVWVEFYQFFHVINFYGNFNWIYDIDERVWSLELENRKTRTVNHYMMLMSILKFWHIVFIFGFWIFFILRVFEIGRVRYPMLSANLQNFVILYLFAWVSMYPWFKFILRRYLDVPYYWFYINNRRLGLRVFFNDITLVYYGIMDYFKFLHNHYFFNYNFYYWYLSNEENNFVSYKKSVLKNIIINALNS